MTDRFNGLIVTLDRDIRDDDAQHIIDAIMMIKGVQSVSGNTTNPSDEIAKSRVKHEISDKLYNLLEEINKM